jgi:hypothetical protein
MAISVHFRHSGFTPKKYDEAVRRLEAAGGRQAAREGGSPCRRLRQPASVLPLVSSSQTVARLPRLAVTSPASLSTAIARFAVPADT